MRAAAFLGLIALSFSAASSARASGLAGTYAGSFSCQLTGGRISAPPSMLVISERSAGSTAELDGVRYSLRAEGGEAELRHCGAINPQYGDANGAQRLWYESAAGGAPVIHLSSRSELGVCEATWTRIDARDPGVPACGE